MTHHCHKILLKHFFHGITAATIIWFIHVGVYKNNEKKKKNAIDNYTRCPVHKKIRLYWEFSSLYMELRMILEGSNVSLSWNRRSYNLQQVCWYESQWIYLIVKGSNGSWFAKLGSRQY